jgi:hypothetical protein
MSRSAIKELFFIEYLLVQRFALCRGIGSPRKNGKYYILLDHFEVPTVAQDSMDFGKEIVPLRE